MDNMMLTNVWSELTENSVKVPAFDSYLQCDRSGSIVYSMRANAKWGLDRLKLVLETYN